eukprot:11435732-Alexandrium_andersonii.AAC.1
MAAGARERPDGHSPYSFMCCLACEIPLHPAPFAGLVLFFSVFSQAAFPALQPVGPIPGPALLIFRFH